jgi:hypothetical protein
MRSRKRNRYGSLYKAVAAFVRPYAYIAGNLTEAGYSATEAAALQLKLGS